VYGKVLIRSFFAGERNEIDLLIEEECFGVDCGDGGQCVGGACVDLPDPGPFDSAELIDFGVSCDRDR
jgi:hypothetical protein